MREYELNGLRFQFTEEDARRLGAVPVETKQAPAPENKAAASKPRKRRPTAGDVK